MIINFTEDNETKAYGFIKSCKSDSIVMDMGEQMYKFAERNEIDLEDNLVEQIHFVRKVQSFGGIVVSSHDGQNA